MEISIHEDVVSHDVFRVTQNEAERKKLLANIVFCQLGLIAEVMVNFFVKAGIAIEIINKFASKFDLSNGDVEILMTNFKGKKEQEVSRVLTVQRGIPLWLQELEGPASGLTKRNPKPLSELLSQEKNN